MNLKVNILIQLVIILLLGTNLWGFSYDVKLSQQQLQDKLDKKFPFEKKKLFTNVKLSNPEVRLKNGSDKIYLNLKITLSASKKISFDAYSELNGKIFFDNETKKLYLKDFEIEELVMNNVPLKFHKTIQRTIETVAKIVLNNYSVYKLQPKNLKNLTIALLLKDIKVKDKTMIISFGI